MKKPLITNIQKYSIHDGEGTRTTVFFKGCPLSCRWCHNPETQSYKNSLLFYEERCIGCGYCAGVCPKGAVSIHIQRAVTDAAKCIACGDCVDECVSSAREICAKTYEISDLVKELLKDRIFYETSSGGVTLSGGEVLSQNMDYVEELMRRLHSRGISVNVDTCGAVPWAALERTLPWTDVFLYDVKLLDSAKHRFYTGRDNAEILSNLLRLSESGAKIWIRIPVIGGVNDAPEEIREIGEFLKKNDICALQVNLLPYHNTGSGKYARVGMVYQGNDFYTPKPEAMEALAEVMRQSVSCPVKVGG